MSLNSELKACLDAAEGCRAAVLVDVEVGLPLAALGSDGADDGKTLAAAAAELLGAVQPASIANEGVSIDHALVLSDAALHIYQRLAAAPDRALCLVFDPGVAPEAALAAARKGQKKVGAAGIW